MWSVKLWGCSHRPGIKPGLLACGLTQAKRRIILRPPTLKFVTLQRFDLQRPRVPVWKDVNVLKNVDSIQGTSIIFRIDFACSNLFHFNSAYNSFRGCTFVKRSLQKGILGSLVYKIFIVIHTFVSQECTTDWYITIIE